MERPAIPIDAHTKAAIRTLSRKSESLNNAITHHLPPSYTDHDETHLRSTHPLPHPLHRRPIRHPTARNRSIALDANQTVRSPSLLCKISHTHPQPDPDTVPSARRSALLPHGRRLRRPQRSELLWFPAGLHSERRVDSQARV